MAPRVSTHSRCGRRTRIQETLLDSDVGQGGRAEQDPQVDAGHRGVLAGVRCAASPRLLGLPGHLSRQDGGKAGGVCVPVESTR